MAWFGLMLVLSPASVTVYAAVGPVTLLKKLTITTFPVGEVPTCSSGASEILRVALYKPANR